MTHPLYFLCLNTKEGEKKERGWVMDISEFLLRNNLSLFIKICNLCYIYDICQRSNRIFSVISQFIVLTIVIFYSQCRGVSNSLSHRNNSYKNHVIITSIIIYYYLILINTILLCYISWNFKNMHLEWLDIYLSIWFGAANSLNYM